MWSPRRVPASSLSGGRSSRDQGRGPPPQALLKIGGGASVGEAEAVADAGLGEDVAGMRRIGLDLPAELVHEHVQVVQFFAVLRSPDAREQGPMRHHAVGVLGEVLERLVL